MSLLAISSILASFWYSSLPESMNLVARNYFMGLLRIFPTTFFVIVGYVFKTRIHQWAEWGLQKRISVLLLSLGLQTAMCLIWNEKIDVHIFVLPTPWLYFLKSLNGSAIILLLAQGIHSRPLRFLGGKTKELMILHYHPPFFFWVVLRLLLEKIFSPNIVGFLIIAAGTLVCCLTIDMIMGRFKVWAFVMGNPLPSSRSLSQTGD